MESLFNVDAPAPEAENGNGSAGQRIESLFRQIAETAKPATPDVDADTVRGIVSDATAPIGERIDALEARIGDIKPASFVVKIGDVTREIPERVHAQFEPLLKLASAKRRDGSRPNILMIGPAGCGKTYAAGQVAESLGFPFSFLSLSGGISESHLIGRYVPTGAGGQFEYTPAPFVEFYRNGGVFLLDELDAADSNVLVVVNAALANGHLRLPDGSTVDRHPDFICIAAANTYGNGADRQYVGRNQLDAATLDRFAACRLDFTYDEDLERSAARSDVCEWAQTLRGKLVEHKTRRIVSTRFIFDASDLLDADAATLDDVKRSLLLDWTDAELAAVGEARPC